MKKMFLLIAALVLISFGQASADVFDFTFTGPTISMSGTLDATSNGDGSFTATGGSGTANGTIAVSLVPNLTPPGVSTSPAGNFYYDDQLFPAGAALIDYWGLVFTAPSSPHGSSVAPTEFNLYSDGGAYVYLENYLNADASYTENGRFTMSPVPEPLSLLFLGFGLVGIAGAKRKFSK